MLGPWEAGQPLRAQLTSVHRGAQEGSLEPCVPTPQGWQSPSLATELAELAAQSGVTGGLGHNGQVPLPIHEPPPECFYCNQLVAPTSHREGLRL